MDPPVWFFVLFILFVLFAIASFIYLFFFKSSTGPRGVKGDQGEIGFTGPRGPPGAGAVGSFPDMVFSFANFAGATFLENPDQKTFTVSQLVADNLVTVAASSIRVYINSLETKTFTIKIKLLIPTAPTNQNFSFTGYGFFVTTNNTALPLSLYEVGFIDTLNLELRFGTSNSVFWTGPGTFPQCTIFFSLTYRSAAT